MPRHEELVRFDQVEEVIGVAQGSPCRCRSLEPRLDGIVMVHGSVRVLPLLCPRTPEPLDPAPLLRLERDDLERLGQAAG